MTDIVLLSNTVAMVTRKSTALLLLLFFFSGSAALMYQVLWVRRLGLLFGSTAQAAALTVAIFFAGLALGGRIWGGLTPRLRPPLRVFGLLELGVALTALGHFFLLDAYHTVYPLLYAVVGHIPALDMLIKAAIATIVLLPPAFLMGGTLPFMTAHMVPVVRRLGGGGGLLYAINTAGSAAGVVAAGFILPLRIGFHGTYLLAVGIDAVVGLSCVALSLHHRSAADTGNAVDTAGTLVGAPQIEPPPPAGTPQTDLPMGGASRADGSARFSERFILSLAFLSGFATLGIEVVWTRLFAQVLQNSVYTYAVVLCCFLIALAFGSLISQLLSRLRFLKPEAVLLGILVLATLSAASSPGLFYRLTGGLGYLGGDTDWAGYIAEVARAAALAMFLPAVCLGMVLPYLLRLSEKSYRAPGEVIGRLVAADTLGAILGSLGAGFVLLPLLGSWRTLNLLALVYCVALAVTARQVVPKQFGRIPRVAAGLTATAAIVLVLTFTPHPRQLGRGLGGSVIEHREGPAASSAVIALAGGNRAIRVNSYYTLGSSSALESERNQTVIPMLLHPNPDSVFFLGMGTGITAGAALSFPVEELVVCEIIDDVIKLANAHFRPYVNGLFDDPRVRIYADDGRTCLSRSAARYDLIISDLFTPWKAGTGNLYTVETYRIGAERLRPGGLYVQWIPLYQVSEREFAIIARTMGEVFPHLTLWRGDLFPSRSIVALVGSLDRPHLDPQVIAQAAARAGASGEADGERDAEFFEALLLRFYAGNLQGSALFADAPVNSDSFPYVEYLAPQTHRQVRAGTGRFLTGSARQELYRRLAEALPPEDDPYLALLDERQRGYVHAGHAYMWYNQLRSLHRDEAARPYLSRYLSFMPPAVSREFSPTRHIIRD